MSTLANHPNEDSKKMAPKMANQSSRDPRERKPSTSQNLTTKLSVIILFLALVDISVFILFRETLWAIISVLAATAGAILALIYVQRENLKTRAAAFGIHSALVAILVLSILGAVNFFTHKHPKKFDLTKEKLNSLSEQTIKTIRGLETPITATYFANEKEQEEAKRVLKLYRDIDPDKFKLEYVNPFIDKQKAISAGINRTKTLHLRTLSGRDAKVEDLTEEKITNSIVKITKTKNIQVCATSGHGEPGLDAQTGESYSAIKKSLLDQSYLARTVSIAQEGKIPVDCQVILIAGTQTNFTNAEIKALTQFLNEGGAMVVSLGLGPKGREASPELLELLKTWGVQVENGIVIDPKFALQSPEFPGAAQYDPNHPITKGSISDTFHPVARALSAAQPPVPGLRFTELAKTSPLSFVETDLSGKNQTRFDPGKDKRGPVALAVAVEGKRPDSKATKSTRIVVFGSSLFVSKQFSQILSANLDFYLNAVGWAADDDSSISIRPKENGPGNVVLSLQMTRIVALVTVVLIPILFAVAGGGIWWIRRRL